MNDKTSQFFRKNKHKIFYTNIHDSNVDFYLDSYNTGHNKFLLLRVNPVGLDYNNPNPLDYNNPNNYALAKYDTDNEELKGFSRKRLTFNKIPHETIEFYKSHEKKIDGKSIENGDPTLVENSTQGGRKTKRRKSKRRKSKRRKTSRAKKSKKRANKKGRKTRK